MQWYTWEYLGYPTHILHKTVGQDRYIKAGSQDVKIQYVVYKHDCIIAGSEVVVSDTYVYQILMSSTLQLTSSSIKYYSVTSISGCLK